jgi:hypothetical protein
MTTTIAQQVSQLVEADGAQPANEVMVAARSLLAQLVGDETGEIRTVTDA